MFLNQNLTQIILNTHQIVFAESAVETNSSFQHRMKIATMPINLCEQYFSLFDPVQLYHQYNFKVSGSFVKTH